MCAVCWTGEDDVFSFSTRMILHQNESKNKEISGENS